MLVPVYYFIVLFIYIEISHTLGTEGPPIAPEGQNLVVYKLL